MVGDIETGNDITEGGTVKGKKEGTQDRAQGYSIGGVKRHLKNYTYFNLLFAV